MQKKIILVYGQWNFYILGNGELKLENIESYKVSSASYVGVSGSAHDLKFYDSKIKETKNIDKVSLIVRP